MEEKDAVLKFKIYVDYCFRTQNDAAKHFGVTAAFISAVMTDKRLPTPKMFKAIGLIKRITYVPGV